MSTLKVTEAFHPGALLLDTLSSDGIVDLMVQDQMRAVRAVELVRNTIVILAQQTAQKIKGGGRLVYVGAGTSGRLAMIDAAECPPTFGIPEGVVVTVMAGGHRAFTSAAEGEEDNTESARTQMHLLKLTEKDVVCGIAASGSTPFVVEALFQARKNRATTVLVRNTKRLEGDISPDFEIVLDTGPEIISGSTRLKAGTAQTIFLKTLTTTIFTLLGHTYGGLMVDVKVTNKKLKKRAVRIVQLLTGLPEPFAEVSLLANDKSVKKTVVANLKKVDSEEAGSLLKKHGGHLRDIIGFIDYTKTEVR